MEIAWAMPRPNSSEALKLLCAMPGIIGSNQDASDCIREAFQESALPLGVIPFVLIKHGGQGKDNQIVSVGLVEKAPPVVSAEARHTFSELRVRVRALGNHGRQSHEDEGGVVEGVLRGDHKGLLRRGRRRDYARADGAEIGHNAKDAARLLFRGRSRLIS